MSSLTGLCLNCHLKTDLMRAEAHDGHAQPRPQPRNQKLFHPLIVVLREDAEQVVRAEDKADDVGEKQKGQHAAETAA